MIAIKTGKLFTMANAGIMDHAVILIEGDKIKAVAADLEIPAEALVIDASDKFTTPGFIDAHTHIGLEEEIYGTVGDDVNEASDPLTPQLQAVDGINFADLAFEDALNGGVTRSMCMPGSANIIGGQAVFLKHLAPTLNEMVCHNPWGLKAALGENPKRVYGRQKKTPQTRMASASLMREAFYKAAKLVDRDIDEAENFKQLPVIKVLKGEMPLLVHAHRADDILTALRIKDEFHINMVIQHGTEAFLVADELARRNVPVFLGPLLVNRAKVEMKEVSFKNARRLEKSGVKFSLITDHPVIPIEYLRICAALTVREGLDDYSALEALTCRPAEILGLNNEVGSISPGKQADIAVFEGHPFDYRSKVAMVLVDGRIWGGNSEKR